MTCDPNYVAGNANGPLHPCTKVLRIDDLAREMEWVRTEDIESIADAMASAMD